MKRFAFPFVALLAVILLLSSCGKNSDEPKGAPSSSVTLASFLSSNEFDALAKGIADGTDLPSELFYATANGYADTITDQSLIAIAWDRLCSVEINPDSSEHQVINDAGICFAFKWDDGKDVTFGFSTPSYFEPKAGELYPVQNSGVVRQLMTSIETEIKQNRLLSEGLEEVKLDDGTFLWDADGDGQEETFWCAFVDNGDEAPSNTEISCPGGNYYPTWIDNCFDISSIASGVDDQGPFLYITYWAGDKANGVEMACILRAEGDQLMVAQ